MNKIIKHISFISAFLLLFLTSCEDTDNQANVVVERFDITKIEVKSTGEEFEEYNPNWKYLKVFTWDKVMASRKADQAKAKAAGEDSEEEFTFELNDADRLPFDLLRIDSPNDTVGDLEQKIADQLKLPIEKLMILLRHEQIYSQ